MNNLNLSPLGITTDYNAKALEGGRNNRVFKVKHKENTFLLKKYFSSPKDPRARLFSEITFSNYLWSTGCKVIAQPLADDPQQNIALFEFIEGKKVKPSEITENLVEQTLDFFLSINKDINSKKAKKIPQASESCFSLNDHLQYVDKRIDRLKGIKQTAKEDLFAFDFITHKLDPQWKKVKDRLKNKQFDQQKCLSPSDFGFHNALQTKDGSLKFLDFEYAGWDDPAKMVCDFFCQEEIPLPIKYFSSFSRKVANAFPYSDNLLSKIDDLFPLYQIKWCCIILNEFLTTGKQRRQFSTQNQQISKTKVQQLSKAQKLFNKIEV